MAEWISVKDRMPEETDTYLVVDTVGEMDILLFDKHRGEFMEEDINGYEFPFTFVTHWMPLPNPPEASD